MLNFKDASSKEIFAADRKSVEWFKARAPSRMVEPGTELGIIWSPLSKRNMNSMLGEH